MIVKTNSATGLAQKNGVPKQPIPTYTYSGTSEYIDEGGGNWKLRFLTSGTFKITSTNPNPYYIDVFLVGGGGSGSRDSYSGGGGSGYTATRFGIALTPNSNYSIVIGAGGASVNLNVSGNNGDSTSAFGYSVNGGEGAFHYSNWGLGGNGGSGGGAPGEAGGIDGSNGSGTQRIGWGQYHTTREFEETTGNLYATGGNGGTAATGVSGTANTGDGGSGGSNISGAGGSGIVIIRNTRQAIVSNLNFTYTGQYQLINDTNDNWRIKFLSNGTFRMLAMPTGQSTIDIFLVGAGGGGSCDEYAGGGGGGYTKTQRNFSIAIGTDYPIVIGAGGSGGAVGGSGSAGGATTAFGFTADGGAGSVHTSNLGTGGNGGSGGAGARAGVNGINGSSATGANYPATDGIGQLVTTREFSETGATLYSTGGTYGIWQARGKVGYPNSGDGGGGAGYYSYATGGSGGSGIVIIRNHRQTPALLSLYSYGGENDITGGWYVYRNSTNGDVYAEKNTDHIKIGYVLRPSGSHEWAYAETLNKVDLSQYSTITIHTKETGNVLGTGNIQFGVSTVRGDMNGYNLVEINTQTGEHDTTYDISSITASLYIRIRAYRSSGGSNNCQCYIYSITLS